MSKQPDWAIRIGAWFLENGHRALLALTGGRYPKKVLGMQPVELYTIGSKTGQRRGTLLTAPIYEPDRVVLVASYGGGTENPAWYKNLVKNPAVEIAVDDVARPLRRTPPRPRRRPRCGPRSSRSTRAMRATRRTPTGISPSSSACRPSAGP